MDMMLLKVALTSQKVDDLLEQVHSNKIELGATFQIKDYLTGLYIHEMSLPNHVFFFF